MTQTDAHVAALTEAFDAMNSGDPNKFVELLSDDFTVSAWTLDGGQRLLNKPQYLEAFGIVNKLDEVKTELAETRKVGDDIVDATVRCYRKLGNIVMDTNIVMGFRFNNGKVSRMVELCSAPFEAFWDQAGITE